MPLTSQTLTVTIHRSADDVYRFASNPENFPAWAPGLCRSIRKTGEDWTIDTANGPVRLRMAEPNRYRVLDHYVTPSAGVEIYIPMRVLMNGPDASEVIFTLFRLPDMSDEAFATDAAMVKRDLETLKRILEQPRLRLD